MCGRLRGECSLSALKSYIERLERGRRKESWSCELNDTPFLFCDVCGSLQWYEGCERTFILHKARSVHDDTLNQANSSSSRGPVPSYVTARAAAGLDLPLLEMTTMGASVSTAMATHHYLGPAALISPNSEAMETGESSRRWGGAGSTEESEREAVADFLVSDLNTELYTELMIGLRP